MRQETRKWCQTLFPSEAQPCSGHHQGGHGMPSTAGARSRAKRSAGTERVSAQKASDTDDHAPRPPSSFSCPHFFGPHLPSPAPRPFLGVSLIEMVIAISILAGGLVVAMIVFPVGLRTSRRAEMNSRATILAQRTVEAVKLESWDELIEGETIIREDDFDVTRRIETADVEGLEDPTRLKKILVRVSWKERGKERDLMFATYVRRDAE